MSESTIASFAAADGTNPESNVVVDAAGDIFGTTVQGGPDGGGSVFEIKAGTSTITTLYHFTGMGADGAGPTSLVMDAAGDLIGTTQNGGLDHDGTVFEIQAGATTATTLYSFEGDDEQAPTGGVALDGSGDIFGTTQYGGLNDDGTVFEIKAGTDTATTLYSFTGASGSNILGSLTLDAAGNLIGTASNGGSNGDGTVFEVNVASGAETTLVNFDGTNGANPEGGVVIDAAGDIFGTTGEGGADGRGTVFEIKAGTDTPVTLYSFTGTGNTTDGTEPTGNLALDAAGDVFGTTVEGGLDDEGTVFEIKAGATTAVTLHSFTDMGTDGGFPIGGLTFDNAGDLIGTTFEGGDNNEGTVFEVANAVCYFPGTLIMTPDGARSVESLGAGDVVLTADGRSMPVRWIGRHTISTRFADPLKVLPIRIKAGALDDGLPERDLLLSPAHALLVDDILVQASALVNGLSVIREANVPETFVYYHVEVAEHALILAEGVPAETFVDHIDRMAFDNWEEHRSLCGDVQIEEMPLPRAQSRRQVPVEIHARLMARAKAAFLPINAVA